MQKMGLFRNVIKSGYLIRFGHQNQGISSFLGDIPRAFSTEAGEATEGLSSILDPFYNNPTTGLTYGKLIGVTNRTTRNDAYHLLEDSNLTLDDLKVFYSPSYTAIGMLVRFPSRSAYDNAVRTLNRKGRLYRMAGVSPEQWESVLSYSGRAVLLQGIPRNAVLEDIDRFLSGCHHDGKSMKIFLRYAEPEPIRMAVVQFPSMSQATFALVTKNNGFCLNSQLSVRVLH